MMGDAHARFNAAEGRLNAAVQALWEAMVAVDPNPYDGSEDAERAREVYWEARRLYVSAAALRTKCGEEAIRSSE